jgi:hypothetical protein
VRERLPLLLLLLGTGALLFWLLLPVPWRNGPAAVTEEGKNHTRTPRTTRQPASADIHPGTVGVCAKSDSRNRRIGRLITLDSRECEMGT